MNRYRVFRTAWLVIVGIGFITSLLTPSLTGKPARAAGPWFVTPGGSDSSDCLSLAGPCATINAAIGKATSGDTIYVAIGTYTGSDNEVVLIDRSITLSGGWDATFVAQTGMTTIDGGGGRRGIVIISGVTANLERFAIQNGYVYQYDGGGIYNYGILTLNNSTVSGNTSYNGGGILNYYAGNMTLNNSTVSGNTSRGTFGGGIYNFGTLTLNNSTVSGNTGYIGGGVDISDGASLIMNNSTVSGNTGGGGINASGTLIMNNSTSSGNTGGGIGAWGSVILNNSTVSGNMQHGIGAGGTVMLNNSTVSGNIGSGISIQSQSSVTLKNSILAGNIYSGPGQDCSGTMSSSGYNLIGNTSGCTFTPGPGDLINVNAGLGILIGSPGYHPLLPGSPAINAGNPAGCADNLGNPLSTDQRGVARVGRCDMGAYEYTPPGPATRVMTLEGTPQNTPPLWAFKTPLKVLVLDSIGSPVSNAQVTFSAPASGASGTFADSGTNISTGMADAGGVLTAATFTANNVIGSYQVMATVNGVVTPATFLLANIAWYVMPAGNDSNNCTSPITPCATINGAIGKATPRDMIYVATGTYTSSSGAEVALIDKDITLSGGWDATFTTQTGTSTIDGGGARRGISINSTLIVNIERFIIQNSWVEWGGIGGSGINNEGTLTLNNSTVSNNTGWGINGRITGPTVFVFLNNSAVKGNTSGGIGAVSITLDNSTVSNNRGLGITGAGGTMTLNNSTVSGNTGLGISGCCSLILNNSTVSNNTGGGIETGGNSSTTFLNNSTVSGNSRTGDGGGILAWGGTITIQNSIVAGNTASGNGPDCNGNIISAGYNLIGNATGCNLSPASGNLTNVNAFLSVLISSPGYHPLLPGSPAINAGNPAGCTDHLGNPLNADQRNASRVGRCDMGAYEYTSPGPAARIVSMQGTPQVTAPLTPFLIALKAGVLDSIGSPVSNAQVTFTAPVSGASGTFADSGTNTSMGISNASGVATAATFTANNFTGTYLVTAGVSGVITPADFSLTNGWWYVTSAGNNINNCTSPATPCATINGALGKDGFTSGSSIFVASGIYTSSPDNYGVLLNKSATLSGGWDATFTAQNGMTTIDGASISINSSLDVSIERFIVQNGGGIGNSGNLTLSNSTVSGNGGSGGIRNAGTMIMNNSTVSGNYFMPSFGGGGITNQGTLTLNNSTVSNNTAGAALSSGGIYTAGTLTLNNSTIRGNGSPSGGGIGITGGTAVISNTTIIGNAGMDGGGISIYAGNLSMTNSTVYSNTAEYGGGMYISNSIVTLNNMTINDNKSNTSGGGIFKNNQSVLSLKNSTISGNKATWEYGGGIYNHSGTVTLDNSTVSGNTAQNGHGGGIFNNTPSTMALNNSTISDNTGAQGGGISNWGALTMRNSILAGNTSSGASRDCYSGISSAGYNLIGNATGCAITGDTTGNLTGVAPLLGPLQDNGGPTLTQALLSDSPAINAGNPTGCTDHQGNPLASDQRGKPRIARCDMGAYELQPLGFSNKLADRQISHPGAAISYAITLNNPGTSEITSVQLTDDLPNNLEYVAGSLFASKGQASYLNGVISWSGALAAQEEVHVAFSAKVDALAPLFQPITNTAEILGDGEAFLRNAVVQIEPYRIYAPFISKPCLPVYSDGFSNPASGWPVGDDGNYRYEYLNGEYRILVRPAQGGAGTFPGFQASDYSVSVNLHNQDGVAGSYGIAFGVAGDWSSFYTLEIFPDGWYGIYRYDPGEVITLAEEFSPAIYQGTASNQIKVEHNGASINAYANGQLLASVTDGTYTGSRYIGLGVFSYDQPNVDIRFDNFSVYPTTCQGSTASLGDASVGARLPSQRMLNTHSVEKDHSNTKTGGETAR